MEARKYDLQVWLRDREQTLQRGEWLVSHAGLTRAQAVGLSVEARTKGERSRIVLYGTNEWAQCFEVCSTGRVLEAAFRCEVDAGWYTETLRELGVMRCDVWEVWRCYACEERSVGLRDLRPEGGQLEPACGRHFDPSLGGGFHRSQGDRAGLVRMR